MKKKKALVIMLALIAATLSVWRIWPHTLREIIGASDEPLDSIIIHVTEKDVVDGRAKVDAYQLEISPSNSEAYNYVVSLLEGTKYQKGFRNLLPMANNAIDSGSHFGMLSITGADFDASCYVSYYQNQAKLFYVGSDSGFLVYHPTNRTVLNQLLTYTMEHGVFQE